LVVFGMVILAIATKDVRDCPVFDSRNPKCRGVT